MAIIGDKKRKDVTSRKDAGKPAKRLKRSLSLSMTEDEGLATEDMSNKESRKYQSAKKKTAKKARKVYNKDVRKGSTEINDLVGGLNYGDAETALAGTLGQSVKNIARTDIGFVGEVDGKLKDLSQYFDDDGKFVTEETEETEETTDPSEGTTDPSDPLQNETGDLLDQDEILDADQNTLAKVGRDEMFKDLVEEGKITENEDGTVTYDPTDPEVDAWFNYVKEAQEAGVLTDDDEDDTQQETVKYDGKDIPVFDGNFNQAYKNARAAGLKQGDVFSNDGKVYSATSANEKGSWWDGTPYVPGESRDETITRTSGSSDGQTGIGTTSDTEPFSSETADGVQGLDVKNLTGDIDSSGSVDLYEKDILRFQDSIATATDPAQIAMYEDSIVNSMMEKALSESSSNEYTNPDEYETGEDKFTYTGASQDAMRSYGWAGLATDIANKRIPSGDLIKGSNKFKNVGKTILNRTLLSKESKITGRNVAGSIGRSFAIFHGIASTADGVTNLIDGNYGEAGLDFAEGYVMLRGNKVPNDIQKLYRIFANKFGKKAAQDMIAGKILQLPAAKVIRNEVLQLGTRMMGPGSRAWTVRSPIQSVGGPKPNVGLKSQTKLLKPGPSKADLVKKTMDKFKKSTTTFKNLPKPRADQYAKIAKEQAKLQSKKTVTKSVIKNRLWNAIKTNPTKFVRVIGTKFPSMAPRLAGLLGFVGPQAAEPISTAVGLGLTAWLLYDLADMGIEIYDLLESEGMNYSDADIKALNAEKQKESLRGKPEGYENWGEGAKSGYRQYQMHQSGLGPKMAAGGKMYKNGGHPDEHSLPEGGPEDPEKEKIKEYTLKDLKGTEVYPGGGPPSQGALDFVHYVNTGENRFPKDQHMGKADAVRQWWIATQKTPAEPVLERKHGGHMQLRHNNGNDATYKKGGSVKKKRRYSSRYANAIANENLNNNNSGD